MLNNIKLGNTKLVAYGIQNEESDMRAHVSVVTESVYVFSTVAGAKAAESGNFTAKPVYTGTIQTALGYVIPPSAIEGCTGIRIPQDIIKRAGFSEYDNTSTKGNKAVFVVKEMLKRRMLPIKLDIEEITDENLQIKGTDIYIKAEAKIQVKCDYKAGDRSRGGTGNLFIQIAEANPYKRH